MMSDSADQVMASVVHTYLEQGYPPYQVWWVELPGDDPSVRELEARRLITATALGRTRFSLARAGLGFILDTVPMSDEADELLAKIGEEYRTAGFPPITTTAWKCERGDKTVNELVARGFVEITAMGGGTFRLTDYGQRWVMDHT